MILSAFTFVHGALDGGYPICETIDALLPFVDEFVVVDADSRDGTRALLDRMARREPRIKVIGTAWGRDAGATLARLHAMNELCEGDTVFHVEADEVCDSWLASDVVALARSGVQDIAIHRIQVEQNGQRCRWYPWPVHRVFPKGSVKKVGHTTDRHNDATLLGPEYGLLWDVTNWFRDTWLGRIKQQSELRSGEAFNFLAVPHHALEPTTPADVRELLNQPHWGWKVSPFALPDSLKRLVGMSHYEPPDKWKGC